jgi:hypothetical protein
MAGSGSEPERVLVRGCCCHFCCHRPARWSSNLRATAEWKRVSKHRLTGADCEAASTTEPNPVGVTGPSGDIFSSWRSAAARC